MGKDEDDGGVGVQVKRWGNGKVDPRLMVAMQAAPPRKPPTGLIDISDGFATTWRKTKNDTDWIKAMNYLVKAYDAAEDNETIKLINDRLKQLKQEMELDQVLSK